MKKTKLEKGITLIALIITIVVLLILAVVTIGAVQESKIIKHAQNAASTYKTKADEEDTILEGYLSTIEENLPGADNGENDDSSEEIVWVYEEYQYGDEEPEYMLWFIGNTTELELIEDREVKAYVGKNNEDTGELEYDENKIITVKLSEVNNIYNSTEIEKLTVGRQSIIDRMGFGGIKELIISGDIIDIPSYCFSEADLEKVVIEDGVKTIGEYAFHKNDNLTSVTLPKSIISIGGSVFTSNNLEAINYGGTKKEWDNIEIAQFAISSGIKIIFSDGTEMQWGNK